MTDQRSGIEMRFKTGEPEPPERGGGGPWLGALAVGAVAAAAAAAWIHFRSAEPGLDDRTRLRLAPRPPSSGGADASSSS